MGVVVFTVGLAAVVVAAALAASLLSLRPIAFLLAVYLIAWSEIVGLTEVLSFVDGVGRAGYLAGEGALLVLALTLWHRRGRPRPPRPRLAWRVLVDSPPLALLALVVAGSLGYELFVGLATPPNNYDVLTYHLPRAVAWLQQGRVDYFAASTQRANAFPPNAEIGVLYTLALVGRDTLTFVPQLLAETAVIATVYGTARRLAFTAPASLFAALATATLSEVALEATTAQNDLVVAAFVAIAAFFLLGERRELPLAGLAVGLAVGTKLTGLVALPLLLVLAFGLVQRRGALRFVGWAAAGVLAFGTFGYAENVLHTGHPLGVVPEAKPYTAKVSAAGAVSTVARVYWRFVDFSGIELGSGAERATAAAGRSLFAAAGIPANPAGTTATRFGFRPNTSADEDRSYFGPLGFLLVLPIGFGFALAWLARRTSRKRGLVALAVPLYVAALAVTSSYDMWLGRFMITPVVLTMPLVAWVYSRGAALRIAIAIAGAVVLTATHAYSVWKPTGLEGQQVAWSSQRLAVQNLYRPSIVPALRAVAREVPADVRLGVVFGNDQPTYQLYGSQLARRLVALPVRHAIAEAGRRHLEWVLFGGAPAPAHRPGWRRRALPNGWWLLVRAGAHPGVPQRTAAPRL